MGRITNTTREVEEKPATALAMAMFGGGIEASERRGQQELVNSDRLPTDTRDEAAFLALGFAFGEPDPSDPMFRPATLPQGWKREASDHDMWSHIVDERGIRRVAVFYKAAFYDRSAHMSLENVGYAAGNGALYGDGAPTPESMKLALLTKDEKRELRRCLDRMHENIAEYPDIYSKYAKRLAVVESLVSADV